MSVAPLQAYRVRDWYAVERDDKPLRFSYDLGPNSIVIDDGGFQGDFADEIHVRYGCTVYVFEPLPVYYEHMARRFAGNEKIKLLPYGLGARDEVLKFTASGDASSSFKDGDETVDAPIRSVKGAFAELGLSKIDLMKINVEGAEYETIEALVSSGLISSIRDLQVQFHDFVPDAHEKLVKARNSLMPTHAPTYMFSFVWENWRRIDGAPDAELRQHLFIATDYLRETLRTREREIDQLTLKAHWIDLAWQSETKALREEIAKIKQMPSVGRRILNRLRRPLARWQR